MYEIGRTDDSESQMVEMQNVTLRGVKTTRISLIIRNKKQRREVVREGALQFLVSFPYSHVPTSPTHPSSMTVSGQPSMGLKAGQETNKRSQALVMHGSLCDTGKVGHR